MGTVRRLAIVAVVGGCGRVGFDPNAGGTGAPDGATGQMVGSAGKDASGFPTGAGAISGTAPDGMPFTTLAVAYVVGHPQYAGGTSIYLVSKLVTCAELAMVGWGQRLPALTQTMDLELAGTSISFYPVAGNSPPSPAQGFGRYRRSFGNGELTIGGTGGNVIVGEIASDGSVSGTFTIDFGAYGPLQGTFAAAACPDGHAAGP